VEESVPILPVAVKEGKQPVQFLPVAVKEGKQPVQFLPGCEGREAAGAVLAWL
jgi:hypothetical protein